MRWVDIEVLSGTQGKPELALHAASQQRLQALLPDGHAATLHLSLSDEFPYASAWVIIEARHA
jgi:holo-[acyl-carrier protein] synthase